MGCSSMQLYDVQQAIDLTWLQSFALAKCITTLTTCTVIMLWNTRDFPPECVACIVIFASLFIGSYFVTALRVEHCVDMALRKRDWQLGWLAIARTQIRERREGEHKALDLTEYAQRVSDCAKVFQRRFLHFYFIRLVAALAPSEMAFFAEAMVAFVTGLSAIHGNLRTTEAAALIGAVRLLADQLKALVTI